jgi:hypothetical protein
MQCLPIIVARINKPNVLNKNKTIMKTKNTGKLSAIAAFTFIILCAMSCKKTDLASAGKAGTSTVSIYLTDDPSPVFDNLFIDIQRVEVKAEDDSEAQNENGHEAEHDENDRNGATDGGWITLDIKPGVYDLLRFRNGLDTVLGTTSFANTKNLKKIRLTLGQDNHGVLNGVSVPLVIKDKNNILVINLEEEPQSNNGQFQLSVDIDAGRSVRQHGNEFELEPRFKGFNRAKAGSIEGRVLPADARAIVFAINGTDTTSAIPENEGEFKIVGLKDGNYTLLVHATANNYLDNRTQVVVAGKEDTHVQPITLHK